MIQKQVHWMPYELKSRDVERRFVTYELLLQRQKIKGSCTVLWLAMKSGYTTIIQSVENCGIIENRGAMHQHRPQNRITMVRSFFSVFCGNEQGVIHCELLKTNETIRVVRYGLQLMRLSRSLKEKWALYAQRHDKVFCYMTTLGLVLQNQWKPTWKRFNGKFYPTRRIHLTYPLPIFTYLVRWHMA